jgi:hypothetical protein
MNHNVTSCTVCGMLQIGHPDDDVCCDTCEWLNFDGDPLRHPELPLVPDRHGLTFLGTWTWSQARGIEETP